MNDGFGILIAFCVLFGIIHGYLKTHGKKPMLADNKPIHTDLEEFDSDDIDREVDEMPDDSLIYDIFN
jgi:hypothetical protein